MELDRTVEVPTARKERGMSGHVGSTDKKTKTTKKKKDKSKERDRSPSKAEDDDQRQETKGEPKEERSSTLAEELTPRTAAMKKKAKTTKAKAPANAGLDKKKSSTAPGDIGRGAAIPVRKSAEDARPHGLSASSLSVLPSFLRRRTNTSSSRSESADTLPPPATATTATATTRKKDLRRSDGRDGKRSAVADLATRSVSHSSASGGGSMIDRSPRSTRKLHRLPGFGLSSNNHDKSILISSDSLMAVLDEDDPTLRLTRSSASSSAGDTDRSKLLANAEERLGSDMMTTSFDTLSALSSDSASDDEDEGNYWDDAWVADENEVEERRQWQERERALEAKHRRREAKQRRLDERWEAEEKLRCEARDRRLADEEELRRNMAAAASSSGLMTRYGAKKNKTMIILRGMVARDVPSITTTDSPLAPAESPAHLGASGMTRVRSAEVPSIEEKEEEERSDGTSAEAAPATTAKKFERPPLLRRRSGSEADLRRYADQLVVPSHRGRSSSSSAGPSAVASSAADNDKESSAAEPKQKTKTKTKTKTKKGSKGTPQQSCASPESSFIGDDHTV